MGYELKRFIEGIDEEFLCTICTMVLEEAMQSPCDHLFCKECITEWLAAELSCPVDRGALQMVELKPAARFFRNLLGKFMIKCDFERQGCEQVVPLEHLRSHAVKCEKNPNAEVVCDKGCNLKMFRHEYQSSDCFTHISSVLLQKDSEITRLSSLASRLEVENKQMNDELHQQKEENRQMNEAIYRLRSQINSSLLKWRRCENIKFSGETFNVMEIENKTRTVFAQYFYSLEPSFCFGVMILDWAVDSWMVIGLTRKHYPSYDPPGWSDESIGYNSYGCIQIDKTSAKVGDGWQNGDAVHCGIKFRQDTNDFLVMFLKNEKHVIEKCMQIPRDGLYPTICMWNTKIRYLNQ